MNKKVIERILKNLLENDTYTLDKEETSILLQYIADLQKEVEILKRPLIENWKNAQTIKVKHPLQYRIDKAIELLQKYDDKEINMYAPIYETINILQGNDK